MSNFPDLQPYENPTLSRDPDLDARLHLEGSFGELHATFRWFCWKRLLIQLPGTLTALLMLSLFFYLLGSDLLKMFESRKFSVPWLELLFTGGCLLIGLWGLYQVAAILINSSRIQLTAQSLTVTHGPLPFPGSRSILCSDIKELSWEQIKKTGVFLFVPVEGSANLTPRATFYPLCATLKDGSKYELLFGPDEWVIRYLKEILTGQLRSQNYSLAGAVDVIPIGLQVQREPGRVQVTYRWLSWKTVLIALSIAVTSVVVAYLYGSSREEDDMFHDILALGLLLVALYMMYWGLTNAFNSTTIEISRERVRIHHGPLPWPGNRTVPFKELQSLAITGKEHQADEPAVHELKATLKNGKTIKIWSDSVCARSEYIKRLVEEQQSQQPLFF